MTSLCTLRIFSSNFSLCSTFSFAINIVIDGIALPKHFEPHIVDLGNLSFSIEGHRYSKDS